MHRSTKRLTRSAKRRLNGIFADAKGKHAMRYTQYRGLIQVTNCEKLKFAAMNVKKLAAWKWNDLFYSLFFRFFCSKYARNPAAA